MRLDPRVRIVAAIAEKAAIAGLEFLVIGGNAVIAYGYPRTTTDLDLLVRELDRRKWDELIIPLGFYQHQIQRVFHMYNPLRHDMPPVDLMLVDAGTFEKLFANSVESTLAYAKIRLPSLKHLIALKLHALRTDQSHRRERDLGDVVSLIAINKVDLAAEEYGEIIERYATPALVEEIRRRLSGPD